MMAFVGAFMLGLLSAPHCLGMCGGIASALLMGARAEERMTLQLQNDGQTLAARPVPVNMIWSAARFGTGKLLGYGALGAIAGGSGLAITAMGAPVFILRTVTALLLLAMGLYIGGWWAGLRRLESAAFHLWQPALRLLGRLQRGSTPGISQLSAGLVWGLLPCGLVYSMLGLAMTSGSSVRGAGLMLSFGLGTLPFVLAAGATAQMAEAQLRQSQVRLWLNDERVRKLLGLLLIASGLLSLYLLGLHDPLSHTGTTLVPEHHR